MYKENKTYSHPNRLVIYVNYKFKLKIQLKKDYLNTTLSV